jgi:hydrogenase maturation protein HypF
MSVPAAPPSVDTSALRRLRLLVRGAVQGVGFRPFVYRQAQALGLAGWVGNSTEGLSVEAEGDPARIDALVRTIRDTPPPNAVVSAVEIATIAPCGDRAFAIRESVAAGARTAQILPDLATCADCLGELFDPADRRYRYPFLNCTQCGPRYSIVESMPYDRARTSMRHFPICAACRAEYENPADRRFHAEPNACPDCGPRLALWDRDGSVLADAEDALGAATAALRQGRIVAVKGIGGFHLMADAGSEAAIGSLRLRKRRPEKPFAVMFPSLAAVAESCCVSALEERLLVSPARSIVLLRRRGRPVAEAVAPGNPWLGVLLPYAPLHHLLLRGVGFPLVATSGNAADEPIVTDERVALVRLAGIADLFLVHDRPIVRPIDDSVMRVVCGRGQILRRARGHAPAAIGIADIAPGILALGGHRKASIALSVAGGVVAGQHLGDLDSPEARVGHASAVEDTLRLHAALPRLVVRDLHPDYASGQAADAMGAPVLAVPHHVAHVASCMAEHGIRPPALGVAWDGAGYGADGTIWGGEFLHITDAGWRRAAHLRPFRLPGGEAAAREPRRAALGLLYEAFADDAFDMTGLAPLESFSEAEHGVLRSMLKGGVNAPLSSSAGRLFDAFAALAGLRQRCSYEGQAAAELEWAADGAPGGHAYALPFDPATTMIDWRPALVAALADLAAGAGPGVVSAALHAGLAAAIVAVAVRIGEPRVILTGGCFQNRLLTEGAAAALRAAGFEPVWHERVPPNDGGLALGQAVWAHWTEGRGEMPCV